MSRPTGPGPFAQVIPLHAPGKQPKAETPVTVAKHRGRRCGGVTCRDPIRKGEPIQRVDGRWTHAECVPEDAIETWQSPRDRAA